MRVNVYNEEFPTEVRLIETTTRHNQERVFGVRFYLNSDPELQPRADMDDERSAITFWQNTVRNPNPADYHTRLLITLQAAVRLIEDRQREQK